MKVALRSHLGGVFMASYFPMESMCLRDWRRTFSDHQFTLAEGPRLFLHLQSACTWDRSNWLIDEYGRCTWVCSVLLLLLSTLGLNWACQQEASIFCYTDPQREAFDFLVSPVMEMKHYQDHCITDIKSHSVTFSNTGILVLPLKKLK